MKDFKRKNLSFSLCGLNCSLCPMKVGGYCPGCGGGEGNQSCGIAKCSIEHDNVQYCFLCSEYPCTKYEEIDRYDSFITHRHQLGDMKKAQTEGIENYTRQQERKSKILKQLLQDYNDGRRKTFYCLAVNLLPLSEIEKVMENLKNFNGLNDLDVKEKAEKVTDDLKRIGREKGILLKMNKKP